jgi:hypothetical protein
VVSGPCVPQRAPGTDASPPHVPVVTSLWGEHRPSAGPSSPVRALYICSGFQCLSSPGPSCHSKQRKTEMPALPPTGLAHTHADTPIAGVASPSRPCGDKSARSSICFSRYFTRTATADGQARPGHLSEPTDGRACPAVLFASGPTALCAGGSSSKPRAAIGAEDRARETARKPGNPHSRERAERPAGAESASGELEARQVARTGKLDRAADECPDRASTANRAERRPGAERRSERTNRPDRSAGAHRGPHAVDSQQRGLALDLEGRAYRVTEGNPSRAVLSAVLSRWSL